MDGITKLSISPVSALDNAKQATTRKRVSSLESQELTQAMILSILGNSVDADLLDGLDSTAFAWLSGQAGGQTLRGDTASGGSLTLMSTLHATKGKILFGTSGYDEVNNRLGVGTSTPAAKISLYDGGESTTQTNFTQALTNAGLHIVTDYTANAFTPGIFWSTQNENATKPKAGIYLKETSTGTNLYLGTSNDYGSGITNDGIVINPSGNVGIGTTAPGYRMHIKGDNSSSFAIIKLENAQASGRSWWLYSGAAGTAGSFGIYDETATAYRMVINSSGNIGIGTTAPGYKLDATDRICLRTGGSGTAGAWLTDAAGNGRAFVGLLTDDSDPEAGLWVNGNWRIWSNSTVTTVTGNLAVDGNFGNWSTPDYGTNWVDYGGSYGGVRYRKLGDMVMLQGLSISTATPGTTIATLPAGYIPVSHRVFSVSSSVGIIRLDVNNNGTITTPGTTFTGSNQWVSLNGVIFYTT